MVRAVHRVSAMRSITPSADEEDNPKGSKYY